MTHLIGISIGFTFYDNTSCKSNLNCINQSNSEVKDSMSTNYKNDMWIEITNILQTQTQASSEHLQTQQN